MKRPLGYEVKTLARMMKQRIDDTEFMRTNEQMTGMQGWVLGYFTRHDGEEIFQRDLEAEFRVRRSTMTQLLNTMESRGLIERVEYEKDRRLKKIVPTTLAREFMERSIEAINEAEAQLTQGFSQQELDTFYSFIERCKYNLGGESAQKE
ncbi:MAG TPA: MarR family transcriptional regulator [Candidatus Ornithoclostridium faecavium]|nr:MarR family transcriptional regulator [Candidatus Ornithoclostridium faecavium]